MNEEQNLFGPTEEEKKEEAVVEESKPVAGKEKDNLRMFLFGFVGLIIAAMIVSGVVGVYRVYAKAATDSFTVGVAKLLRLPAMKVNGERVLFSDYADFYKAIKLSMGSNPAAGSITPEQMSDQVLWWQANAVLTAEASKTFGITIEQKDLDEIRSQMLQQFKTKETADTELRKRYGWDMATYEQKIMRTMILQNKLNDKISLDQKAREEVRAQAEQVLAQIKAGGNFEELAKQYGEDGTAAQGGTLGWFGKGDMVPEFEKAAFALKKGELSPNLVETEFGYHIIRVDDKKVEKVKDANGKMVNSEQVNARHILFRFPGMDKYMDELAKKASFNLYLKVHNPFLAQSQS